MQLFGTRFRMAKLGLALFAVLVASLLVLNLATLATAIPETTKLDSGCCAPADAALAKDFSAYYVGAWRLLNDPAQLYAKGSVTDGGPTILPKPQQFKYLSSFLIFMIPFLASSYQGMLIAFDAFQFLLLPLVALMVYRITREKGLLVSGVVAVLVLLQPSPVPGWGISASYYWQWGEGQAKVLLTFLLVSGLYLTKFGHPRSAGLALALASFDPRFVLLAVPLLVSYSKGSRVKVLTAYAPSVVLLNIPMVLPKVASGYFQMLLAGGALTPPYYYSWIPIITVVSLTVADWRMVWSTLRGVGSTFALGQSLSRRTSNWLACKGRSREPPLKTLFLLL
jgi:hypothetical protein